MITPFSHQLIWIIGASSGIGSAIARALDQSGARVILSARREDALASVAASLSRAPVIVPCDVANRESVDQAIASIRALGQPVDRVLFLAALYEPQRIDRLDRSLVDQSIDVNLRGAFDVIDGVLPLLQTQGRGQIALCASVAGYRGLPGGQPYSCTKAALINLAESLHAEMQGTGIDVRVINPGFVRTPLTDKNDFTMPMMIDADQAAQAIMRGLSGKAFEIHFPKRFTFLMKILRLLPHALYFPLVRRMRRP